VSGSVSESVSVSHTHTLSLSRTDDCTCYMFCSESRRRGQQNIEAKGVNFIFFHHQRVNKHVFYVLFCDGLFARAATHTHL
jgi:hypothetical protein